MSISAVLQLATIVMAGINDVAGVCVGGVLGHTICTGLAGQYWQQTFPKFHNHEECVLVVMTR